MRQFCAFYDFIIFIRASLSTECERGKKIRDVLGIYPVFSLVFLFLDQLSVK